MARAASLSASTAGSETACAMPRPLQPPGYATVLMPHGARAPRQGSRAAADLCAPRQRLHRALEARERDRVHAAVHDAQHVLDGSGPAPVLLGHGIEPGRVRPGAQQPLEPRASGLLVPVLDAAAGLLELVRAHR